MTDILNRLELSPSFQGLQFHSLVFFTFCANHVHKWIEITFHNLCKEKWYFFTETKNNDDYSNFVKSRLKI